jgi:hypothetical protein
MFSFLAALHGLAAPRGEGLRPDLLELLERSSAGAERGRNETASQTEPEAIEPKSLQWEDHLRF